MSPKLQNTHIRMETCYQHFKETTMTNVCIYIYTHTYYSTPKWATCTKVWNKVQTHSIFSWDLLAVLYWSDNFCCLLSWSQVKQPEACDQPTISYCCFWSAEHDHGYSSINLICWGVPCFRRRQQLLEDASLANRIPPWWWLYWLSAENWVRSNWLVVYVVSGVPEKGVGSLVHNPIESDINKQRQYIEPYMEVS